VRARTPDKNNKTQNALLPLACWLEAGGISAKLGASGHWAGPWAWTCHIRTVLGGGGKASARRRDPERDVGWRWGRPEACGKDVMA